MMLIGTLGVVVVVDYGCVGSFPLGDVLPPSGIVERPGASDA